MKYDIQIRATVEYSGDADDLENYSGIGLFDEDFEVLMPRVQGDEEFEVLDYHECEVREVREQGDEDETEI